MHVVALLSLKKQGQGCLPKIFIMIRPYVAGIKKYTFLFNPHCNFSAPFQVIEVHPSPFTSTHDVHLVITGISEASAG